jgi:polyhydroxyalkanoate synthesis regulator protein
MTNAFGVTKFGVMEEFGQKNMDMFRDAMAMFLPFNNIPHAGHGSTSAEKSEANTPTDSDDLNSLKKELTEMQKRLDKLARSGN